MSFTELERFIDREAHRVPPPQAPPTLLPRVMAAVQARAHAPWYTRAWFTWPRAWQAASLAGLLVVVTGLVVLLQDTPPVTSLMPSPVSAGVVSGVVSGAVGDAVSDVSALASGAGNFGTAIRVVWEALLAPVIPYAILIVLAMCLACGVFAAAFNYLVFGKAVR